MLKVKAIGLLAVLTLAAGCTGPGDEQRPPATSDGSATTSVPKTAETGDEDCSIVGGWDAQPQEQDGSSADPLTAVRIGKNDCYERVVFDIDGPGEAGFLVRYVDAVHADGSGEEVALPGKAYLEVILRASMRGYADGKDVFAKTGDYLYSEAQLKSWQTLQAIRFAGFFEGQSTIGIGLRAKVPFRAFTLLDKTTQQRKLVVDVALLLGAGTP